MILFCGLLATLYYNFHQFKKSKNNLLPAPIKKNIELIKDKVPREHYDMIRCLIEKETRSQGSVLDLLNFLLSQGGKGRADYDIIVEIINEFTGSLADYDFDEGDHPKEAGINLMNLN